MGISTQFWNGKRVLLTGDTGFKGSWLSLWLSRLGAQTTGCALPPDGTPNLYTTARVADTVRHEDCDIRDANRLSQLMRREEPEIVIHMAAQSLVRKAYRDPVETYETNVMGTLNLLEAVRHTPSVRSCVIITTDKCYHNEERTHGYREDEPLGGHDPYSSSKACAEILTASYRQSFFPDEEHERHRTAIATARAGNVIGGGDWAEDRLVPDIVRAFLDERSVRLRYPDAVRPWQYVLEPLAGYLMLAERLYEDGSKFAQAWNFGPDDSGIIPVGRLVNDMAENWGGSANWELEETRQPHEAQLLTLDSSKARAALGWQPRMSMEQTLAAIVAWHKACAAGDDMHAFCLEQIHAFESLASE